MSLKVKDKKLFKNYNTIWKKKLKINRHITNLLKVMMINP